MALWRVHVELEDRPGRLGELATAVGAAGCNIISLHVVGEPADDGSVTDELLVKVPESADPGGLVGAVEGAGIPCTLLVRADATELADPATTALALARMVAADPAAHPARWPPCSGRDWSTAAEHADGHTAHHARRGTAAAPGAGVAVHRHRAVARRRAARARRPARDARSGQRAPDRILLLRDGSEMRLREATAADGPLVAALHARCSPQTRRSRFLSPTPRLAPGELAGLLGRGPSRPAVLAVTVDGGSAVGLATLDGDGSARPELAVLVEDAWQGRGLGTALLRAWRRWPPSRGWRS